MNERERLHPIYVLFGLLSVVKGFLPIIILAYINGASWINLGWYWYGGMALLAVLIMVICFLQWRKFEFWLEEDRIIIRKGVLFRDEKTIYYGRIHSVNVEQPIIQRLLRVVQLKIETPGGGKESDGVLYTLSLKQANRIQLFIRNQADLASNTVDSDAPSSTPATGIPAAAMSSPAFRLDPAELLKAAATSLNFGLVAAFLAGLFSLADDFIEALLPQDYLVSFFEDSTSLMPDYLFVTIVITLGLLFAWFLSLALFVLKYSGFTVSWAGKQISVSYGLLEKKTFVFDPKNVQAVIVKESPLRQVIGYAEVQLQVISSNSKEQLMLHPFVKYADIPALLADFVPQLKLPAATDMTKAPKRALLYYIRVPLLLTAALCMAIIAVLKISGAWSLLAIPLVAWWRIVCYKAAGMTLKSGQLALRNRAISRSTYLIRRPQIVAMQAIRTKGQQRKNLRTLSVNSMGSMLGDYRVKCMDYDDVEPIWHWYSRSNSCS